MAWLRIASAAVLFAIWRRPWRSWARLDTPTQRLVIAWGVVLAAMNCCFYEAISKLPLGTVAAIEFLPVVALAAVGARTPRNYAALGLAVGGVYELSHVQLAAEPAGLAFAFANAALFATYIVLAHRAARDPAIEGIDGLAAAMLIAAVVVTPVAGPGGGQGARRPDRAAGGRRSRDLLIGDPVRHRPARDGAAEPLDVLADGRRCCPRLRCSSAW